MKLKNLIRYNMYLYLDPFPSITDVLSFLSSASKKNLLDRYLATQTVRLLGWHRIALCGVKILREFLTWPEGWLMNSHYQLPRERQIWVCVDHCAKLPGKKFDQFVGLNCKSLQVSLICIYFRYQSVRTGHDMKKDMFGIYVEFNRDVILTTNHLSILPMTFLTRVGGIIGVGKELLWVIISVWSYILLFKREFLFLDIWSLF